MSIKDSTVSTIQSNLEYSEQKLGGLMQELETLSMDIARLKSVKEAWFRAKVYEPVLFLPGEIDGVVEMLKTDTHPTFDPDFPFNPQEVFLSDKPMTDADFHGDLVGVALSGGESSAKGWESVTSGGFGEGRNDKFPEPLMKQALDDAVATFRSDDTPNSPEALAAMEEMRGGDDLNARGGSQAFVAIPPSDGKLEGALITAFLRAMPPSETANKWAEQL